MRNESSPWRVAKFLNRTAWHRVVLLFHPQSAEPFDPARTSAFMKGRIPAHADNGAMDEEAKTGTGIRNFRPCRP
jgi:hypothetical protein